MEYTFNVTKEKVEDLDTLEWEAIERAMDGDFKMYRVRPALARFMVDENNLPMPYEQALKMTENLKVKHYRSFMAQFGNIAKDAAVPKSNGSESKLPSEALTADSLSLVGSQP